MDGVPKFIPVVLDGGAVVENVVLVTNCFESAKGAVRDWVRGGGGTRKVLCVKGVELSGFAV